MHPVALVALDVFLHAWALALVAAASSAALILPASASQSQLTMSAALAPRVVLFVGLLPEMVRARAMRVIGPLVARCASAIQMTIRHIVTYTPFPPKRPTATGRILMLIERDSTRSVTLAGSDKVDVLMPQGAVPLGKKAVDFRGFL